MYKNHIPSTLALLILILMCIIHSFLFHWLAIEILNPEDFIINPEFIIRNYEELAQRLNILSLNPSGGLNFIFFLRVIGILL